MTGPHHSTLELAERLGTSARVCDVVSARTLSPSLREIELDGAELAGQPGNDVMVLVGEEPEHVLRRRYSVRSVDRDRGTLTLWVSTSHEGPGAAWASSAEAGQRVDLIGPRGKILLDPGAGWHLFMGDVSALSASYAMASAIPEPGRAIFIVEIDHADDALTATLPDGVGVTGIFVDRRERERNDPAGLLSGLAALAFPDGRGHAYLFAEFSVLQALRRALEDRGLERDRISHKAYWRMGRPNAEHGEPDKDER
jgi:NADPH-dependent ferric siderophore reductase